MSENIINKINLNGVDYSIQEDKLIKTTYSELKSLRDESKLIPGHLYRITDYEFTTKQTNTKSAGNVFDIIVLATSENQLSELARAIQHEGDTYFDGNDLLAWELWYNLDNDTNKYEWADATNGKGVIYRMIDEKHNDCPYDFKNALFYNTKLTTNTTTDKYYYTFSCVVSGKLYDGTVENRVKNCYDNSMGTFTLLAKKSLNLNVFRNDSFLCSCYYNTFGDECRNNTFGDECRLNEFGNDCNNNTFGDECRNNTFGHGFNNNTLRNDCNFNTFGNSCRNNTFGYGFNNNTLGNDCNFNTFGNSCKNNTLGNFCYHNEFGDSCNYNVFRNGCWSNTFGTSCSYNTFGNTCSSNTFGNYYSCNTFENDVHDRELNANKTSITINDEYFDDGSGQLVPVKHPDLSTQPSILPYKFMGQYVYERLIPYIDDDLVLYEQDLIGTKPIILEAQLIGIGGCAVCEVVSSNGGLLVLPKTTEYPHLDSYQYFRIVYTSMPEENGGYYYGGNYGLTYEESTTTTPAPEESTTTTPKPVDPNGYEYVDLGLPSGLKWAKCNIGAEKESDFGLYFAWGEIVGYTANDVKNGLKSFSGEDYKWNDGEWQCDGSSLTKYNSSDNLTTLLPEDDAATVNMGGSWHMPSKEQFEELINTRYTTTTWTTVNGVYGRKITSRTNGNTLFFPAAGYYQEGSVGLVGSYGHYWSSSADSDYSYSVSAYHVSFNSDRCSMNTYKRCSGCALRGVM